MVVFDIILAWLRLCSTETDLLLPSHTVAHPPPHTQSRAHSATHIPGTPLSPPPSAHSPLAQVRNSHGVFLDGGSDPTGFLSWLEERIAAVSMIPPSHGEVR